MIFFNYFNFISTEEKQDYFQSHVHQLRNAITKSRRALQKSLTLARLVSKKYARLKKVVPYRSNGNAFWIEMHFLTMVMEFSFLLVVTTGM